MDLFEFNTDSKVAFLQQKMTEVREEIGKVIVGQQNMLELLMAGLLAGGHVLIEGVPGVAKTLTAKLLAKTINTHFSRIQFTPDLMPSDVIGTPVFNPKESTFVFKKGPIFGNIILIDEVNRAPAKTQSSLFEVMEEKQITVDGVTYILQPPFLVIATQNPIEQEGTYRLPEAQLDRFLFKINVPYPTLEEEINILTNHQQLGGIQALNSIQSVISNEEIVALQQTVNSFVVEEKLLSFIAGIVQETRQHKSLSVGASPRSSIGILIAAKAIAALRGRTFVTPDDIIHVCKPILRHRIILTPEKEMEGTTTDEVIEQIIQSVEIPR